MRIISPAILLVLPMLACTWASPARSHHDYHDYDIVQCPESIDGFYPHPTRCDLYIQCDNVQSPWPSVQVLSCPSGLHWNPFAQHCDWPELACCNATSHATATPPPTTTTTRTYEQNVRCPGNTDGVYPHPTRCDQYIQCVNMQFRRWSAVYLKTCPQGLLYNRHVQSCDWPQNVNCNPFDPISTTSTPAPTTTTDGQTGWVDVPCPGWKPGRYPDPDCRFYLHCTHTGTPEAGVQRIACPDGLYFNPVTTHCDHPANVPNCGEESSTGSTQWADDSGDYWDTGVGSEQPTQPFLSGCDGMDPLSGLYPDLYNCSVYWKCDFLMDSEYSHETRLVCPRGQWFDRDLEYCNDIRDVHNCVVHRFTDGSGYSADGSGYSADGSGYSSDGSGYSSDGSGFSADGSGYSADGSGYSADGSGYSADGSGYSADGSGYSADGSGYSADGSGYSADGSGYSADGSGYSADGSGYSADGSGYSADGSGYSADGSGYSADGSGYSADGSGYSADGFYGSGNSTDGSGYSADRSGNSTDGSGILFYPPLH